MPPSLSCRHPWVPGPAVRALLRRPPPIPGLELRRPPSPAWNW